MDRLIAINCYTKQDLNQDNDCIVCVGNITERKKLANYLEIGKNVSIFGPPCSGKYTSVLDYCEKNNREYIFCEETTDAPLYTDKVCIFRNPTKEIEKYYSTFDDHCIVFLYDEMKKTPANMETIILQPPNSIMKQMYLEKKGVPMIVGENYSQEETDEQLIAKLLRGKHVQVPNNAHRWIARNFLQKEILKLCDLASKVKDKFIYDELIRLVRYRRPIKLIYPKFVIL